MFVPPADLASFLRDANVHTYAAGENRTSHTTKGAIHFEYSNAPWVFRDTYFGDDQFLGQEIVFFHEVPVWGANYYGYTLITIQKKAIYAFLKEALLQQHPAVPVRGPNQYRQRNLIYTNTPNGTLNSFQGIERIYEAEALLYEGFYQGGMIRGREA